MRLRYTNTLSLANDLSLAESVLSNYKKKREILRKIPTRTGNKLVELRKYIDGKFKDELKRISMLKDVIEIKKSLRKLIDSF